jgi:peptidyl-prolyl cis-trans isomerase SurA
MKTPSPLIILYIVLAFQVYSAQANLLDAGAVVVNQDIITLSEIEELAQPIFERIAAEVPLAQQAEARQQAREGIIERLIEKHLLLQQAQQLKISVSEAEIDHAQAQVMERNAVGPEEFRAELRRMGINEAQYRESLKEQLLTSKIVNQAVRSRVVIPEEKIRAYFEEHYLVEDRGRHILQIGFIVEGQKTAADRKAARVKADKVQALARAGEDFRELARQYSNLPSAEDGGDLGILQEDEMAEYIREAVNSLRPGQVSPVVATSDGWMIFKVLSVSEEGAMVSKAPYESVQETIQDILYKQEMEKYYTTWLEELRQGAYIKIL